MFGNFIYIIISILIYTTYQPTSDNNFSFINTIFLFTAIVIVFICASYFQFNNLEKQIAKKKSVHPQHKFQAIVTRQSLMALFIYTIDIYGLNLPSYILKIPFIVKISSLHALLFIMLFVFYLATVWACAYQVCKKLNITGLSRKSYIVSNISFILPVVLPWLLLSGCADAINLLPFEYPKRLLATTQGQVIYFLFSLSAIALLSPFIVQKLWRCKPVETGYVRNRITALCKKAGVEFSDILYWKIFDGDIVTAGVMGLIKRFRYLLVTDALISYLEPEEVDAVVTHEIGHVKKNHLLFYLMFFAGYMLISFAVFDLIIYAVVYTEPLYNIIYKTGLKQTTILSATINLFIVIIFIIYFRYIFGYFMRNFERQADIYVYTLFENAKPLISTFEKIARLTGEPYDKPNWHHFSIKERIDYLKKCETNKAWVVQHNTKVKKSIGVYLAGMLLTGAIGYQISFGDMGKGLNDHFVENIILEEIEHAPNNPELYRIKGDIYFNRKQFSESITAYKRSLELKDNQPYVLNNLAWMLATCENKELVDPKLAVILAQKAVILQPDPNIIDTLAESYYACGRFKDAVQTGKKALNAAGNNKQYYEKQLEKFKLADKKLSK